MLSLKKIYENNIYMLRTPTLSEKDVDPKELVKGIKIETEHTSNIEAAKIIALHHLAEDEKYYTKLEKMEKEFKKDKK